MVSWMECYILLVINTKIKTFFFVKNLNNYYNFNYFQKIIQQ